MPEQHDLQIIHKIDGADANDDPEIIPTLDKKEAKGKNKAILHYAPHRGSRLKRIFGSVKNTVLAKNKAGRVLRGLGIAAVSIFTGVNIQPITQTLNQPIMHDFFTDINFWALVGTAAAVIFGYLKTLTGAKLDAVIDDAESGTQMYIKFKRKDSAGGSTVTEAEKDQLIEHFAEIFEKQAKKNL